LWLLSYLLFIGNYSYSQLPSYGDLGFLNTYKAHKFYWGVTFNTNGKIKSIDQTKYMLRSKSGKLKKGKIIGAIGNDSNFQLKFDEAENLVYQIKFTPLGKIVTSYAYQYDESNHLIEIKGYDSQEECISLNKYTYDELGHLIDEEFITLNTYRKHTHSYDVSGNSIETHYTELHGYPFIMFLLDEFVSGEAKGEDDTYLMAIKSYDIQGNLIQELTYHSNSEKIIGALLETYTCEYNLSGYLSKEFKKIDPIREAKLAIELSHYYDNKGLKTGTNLRFDFGGMKVFINTKLIRDVNGTILEIIENQNTSLNKKIIKYNEKFEYDSYSNISKIYFFKNDKPKRVIERKIEYY
jgi:hypothetical protein